MTLEVHRDRRAVLRASAAALLLPLLAARSQAGSASQRTVLVVTGKVDPRGAPVALTLAQLQALPQHSFRTATPWTSGIDTYTGPLLRDVLKLAQANGQRLKAAALNDYTVEIPLQDALATDVIVAHQVNGKAISVRDKGPLFVIYPFSSRPDLQSTTYYQRSIWQLKSIEVL